jgi:hypothetical protein
MRVDTIDAEAARLCCALDDWKLVVSIDGLSGAPTSDHHSNVLLPGLWLEPLPGVAKSTMIVRVIE